MYERSDMNEYHTIYDVIFGRWQIYMQLNLENLIIWKAKILKMYNVYSIDKIECTQET